MLVSSLEAWLLFCLSVGLTNPVYDQAYPLDLSTNCQLVSETRPKLNIVSSC